MKEIAQGRAAALSLAVCLAFFFPPASTAYSQTWVEDTFEDFRDGKLDAAGQNIYVCRDGTVRTIHRFDLNQDGFIDLLFNSTHDTSSFIPARLAAVDSKRAVTCGLLAVEGSIQAELADFNLDGFTDIVFCPNASGVQNPRRFLTIVWGGPDGWPAGRANGLLPVYGAGGIAVADLNRDSWPDIAVLNDKAWMPGQPAGRILRIYWGGPRGFLLSKFKDIGIPDASGIAAADLDGDGGRELAVLTKRGKVVFLWRADPAGNDAVPGGGARVSPEACGGHVDSSEIELPVKSLLCVGSADFDRDGLPDLAFGAADAESVFLLMGSAEREWRLKAEIAGLQPSRIVLDDLDEDGFIDLVVNSFSISRAAGGEPGAEKKRGDSTVSILWGGPEGFSAARSTGLRLPHASAAAAGDADGDGRKDVAVAVYQGAETFAAESRIFFGRGGRRFELDGDAIPTEGALDAAFAPAEKNLPARLVFCNSQGGFLLEKTPTLLYWGGQRGFDPGNVLRIPFRSGYEATAADLNADGFPDLVAVDSMHAGQAAGEDIFAGANIFWGGERGFDFEDRRTVLTENSLGTSNTADLDKDGYLDLVLGQFGNAGKPTELIIYYGSARGYDADGRVAVPSEGRSTGSLIADFNNDGWLDIGVSCYEKNLFRIFWGSREGFSEKRQALFDVPGAIDLEAADFNGDGYLDLVACSYMDPLTGNHDTGVMIYWGSREGFKPWNAQRLPASTALAPVAADFDENGWLDLFLPAYHDDLHRERLPSYLYWGGPGGFSAHDRTALINDSAADGLAADFDGDGWLDLAVVNHSLDGTHHAFSKVYYNDRRRFRNPRVEPLPTHGPHWMWNEDLGHIVHRRFEQLYESSIFRWNSVARKGKIEVTALIPEGAGLRREIRTAPSAEALESRSWKSVPSGAFELDPADRALQYRMTFRSDNGDRFPVLDKILVNLE